MTTEFRPAKMDMFASAITVIFIIGAVGALIAAFVADGYFWPGLIFSSSLIIALIISFSLSIRKIDLKGESVVLHKPFGNTVELKDISIAERSVAKGIRTGGVGGVFGYYGWFNGNDIWFVTDRKKGIRLQNSEKTWFISPEDPESFIRAWEQRNSA